MIVCAIFLSKHRHIVKRITRFNSNLDFKKYLFIQSSRPKLNQTVNQNKRYFSIDTKAKITHNDKNKVLESFQSKTSNNSKTELQKSPAVQRINKSDINRLLSLAKPEKWRLLGNIS